MGFEQAKKNKEKQNNQNISKGGVVSQMLMETPLMQQRAKEHQVMFGNAIQREENNTGLPDNLKSGMESLSGMSLDHVKVHYNSSKPASVQAYAYAQGSDIHLASGQEKHLPHELGHVVQQAEGRVKPTTTVGGVAVNDSSTLESEATKMGERALQMKSNENSTYLNIDKFNDDNNVVLQGTFHSLDEVKNTKLIPSTSTFTEEEKLDIINWCMDSNSQSNSIKSSYSKELNHSFSHITDNNKKYDFNFIWDLALHMDLGGAKHGDTDTPHLQAVQALHGMSGSTKAEVTLNVDTQKVDNVDVLAFNSSDNAVFIPYHIVKISMEKNNLDKAKEKIFNKILDFSNTWANTFADKHSGSKDERMNKEFDYGGGLFGDDDDDDY